MGAGVLVCCLLGIASIVSLAILVSLWSPLGIRSLTNDSLFAILRREGFDLDDRGFRQRQPESRHQPCFDAGLHHPLSVLLVLLLLHGHCLGLRRGFRSPEVEGELRSSCFGRRVEPRTDLTLSSFSSSPRAKTTPTPTESFDLSYGTQSVVPSSQVSVRF